MAQASHVKRGVFAELNWRNPVFDWRGVLDYAGGMLFFVDLANRGVVR